MSASALIRPSARLLIAAANALVGLGEPSADARLRAMARGLGVSELLNAALPSPEHASWDVAIVQHIGYWSHFDLAAQESTWPLPDVDTPDELWKVATRHHVDRDEPRVGDIFLQYGPAKKQFVRAGLVAQVMEARAYERSARAAWRYYDIVAIEGATELDGRLGGKHVARLVRRLIPACGDRFVRWSELDAGRAGALPLSAHPGADGYTQPRAAA